MGRGFNVILYRDVIRNPMCNTEILWAQGSGNTLPGRNTVNRKG
jgi:hypothetical protein